MENDNRKYEYLHNYVHTQGSKSGITLEGSSQFTSTVVGYLVIPEIEISKWSATSYTFTEHHERIIQHSHIVPLQDYAGIKVLNNHQVYNCVNNCL